MPGVTVEKLATQIGDISPEKLIEQLKSAGVEVSKSSDTVTEEGRLKLLAFLKKQHGEDGDANKASKKISLKRKTVSKLQLKKSAGSAGKKAVVLVRKRRVIVKKEEQVAEKQQETEIEDSTSTEPKIAESTESTAATAKTTKMEATATTEKSTTAKELKESEQQQVKSEAAIKKPSKKESETSKGKDDKDKTKSKPKGKGKGKDKEKDKTKGKDKEGKYKLSKSRILTEGNGEAIEGKKRGKRSLKSQIAAKNKKEEPKEEEINPHGFARPTAPIVYDVKIPETIKVSELANYMSVKAAEVIKIMMKMGVMATINQVIDQDTACLVVEEMGHKAVPVKSFSIEETINVEYDTELQPRPPIVTVMGHVDHGKTSLLDYIRSAKVTSLEAGGITQHIGAYQVTTPRGIITFLDTPGHSAFTAMRARGANCTDLVILVVAADDGVMPQTIEAIQHAKAAKVPIIVAINKVDKAEADLDRVTNELSQHELIPESWGGDTMFMPVSAKTGAGIDELLEGIMIQAELLELKAPATGVAQGVVIEARLDKGRGSVASVLVQQGLFKKGDMVLAGLEYGRVKSMFNAQGASVNQALPAMPVEILGLSSTPKAGDMFQVVADERKAREVALFRQGKHRELKLSRQQASKLEGFMNRMQQGDVKELNIVLKADVQGSIEALKESLEKLSTDKIKVKVISQGVGGFNESDVNLALASQAILIGFNVRAESSARKLIRQEGIDINYYSIIYDVIDGVKSAISGRLGPQYTQKIIGLAEVREVFKSSKIGAIAGCMVLEGIVKRGNPIRVLRDNIVIYEGELESLRRFKENVNEVRNNMECGIGVKNYNDVKVGDQIEAFEVVEVAADVKC